MRFKHTARSAAHVLGTAMRSPRLLGAETGVHWGQASQRASGNCNMSQGVVDATCNSACYEEKSRWMGKGEGEERSAPLTNAAVQPAFSHSCSRRAMMLDGHPRL